MHCPGLAAAEKRNVRINYNSWTFLKVLIFRSLCDLLFMEIIELFFSYVFFKINSRINVHSHRCVALLLWNACIFCWYIFHGDVID